MERARSEWLRAVGYEQDVLARQQGVIFAVRSAAIDFLKPARFNELLHISAAVTHMGRVSLSFKQQVSRMIKGDDSELLAVGQILVVCLEARTFKLKLIPSNLKKDLQSAG